jgi:tRNA (guanine-N7-)-methyltransferase
MENQIRTAEHVARIIKRRSTLIDLVAQLVPPESSFVWEIGCGHGHFLAAYAAAHPTDLCIGVDISLDRIERGIRKRNRAQLGNLHFVHAEALDFLEALPTDATFSSIFILFPDPWPKRRHHKNRILQPEFLAAAAKRAGQGTRLYFRTDYEPYFRDADATIRDHPDWELTSEPWPFEQVTVFQSRAISHHSFVARHQARGA